MRCHVLLFANLAEATGQTSFELELSDGATVRDALDELAARHEAIADAKAGLAVAVNEAYCDVDRALAEGDTIAIIPPVSGG
jgi:molybdopterin converting factor subunit 1